MSSEVEAQPPPEPPAPKTPLWKRLPLIVLVVVGLWLWQGGAGLVTVEHTLVWKVPGAYASVRKVEIGFWDGETVLYKSHLITPHGLTMDPEKRLTIKQGRYRSELTVWREGSEAPEVSRVSVEVNDAATIVIR